MSSLKAFVTKVPFGGIEIEGLMDESGNYYVATPQLVKAEFLARQDHATRELKTLLGNDFKLAKLKTEFDKNVTGAISIIDFERLLAKLDRSGNAKAQELRDLLVGLSLHQLFSDAFGVKFEQEDRQKWIIDRQIHRKDYKPHFCVWGKVDNIDSGVQYATRMRRLKAQVGLDPDLSVNDMDYSQLQTLNKAEYGYHVLRCAGLNHEDAMKGVK